VTPAAAALVQYAWTADGLIESLRDVDLVEQLAIEVAARREAFVAGQQSIKQASVDICRSADWHKVALKLADAQRQRSHRARTLEPRPDDFRGRGAA
jgi:hypothetical protein